MKATVPPPAISGGTLRILPDGHTAVAADPDRDQVYVVDLTKRVVTATFKLSPGDEPGRVVIDGVGRAHVALRRGGALVSFDPRLAPSGQTLLRREVCAAPRGVAYDKGMDLVHVACSDGQLVSLPAAGGAAVRTVTLDRDLRDVVVDGARLKVSRFRTAEILTVEADGTVSGRTSPPAFQAAQARNLQSFTPGIAYKMEALPSGDGVLMVHQRGLFDAIDPVAGGYGGFDTCQTIVHPAVTMVHSNGTVKSGPALAGLVLAVDMAVSHDGARVALVSAGNANNHSPGPVVSELPRVFLTTLDAVTDDQIGCQTDGVHAPCPIFLEAPGVITEGTGNEGGGIDAGVPDSGAGGIGGGSADAGPVGIADAGIGGSRDAGPTASADGSVGGSTGGRAGRAGTGASPACGQPDPSVPQVASMQPIAVAFDGQDNVVVQSREPALLALPGGITISLSSVSRSDTGHDVFHANAGGSLACASCHAEGNDDGARLELHLFGQPTHAVPADRPARHRALPLERRRDRLPTTDERRVRRSDVRTFAGVRPERCTAELDRRPASPEAGSRRRPWRRRAREGAVRGYGAGRVHHLPQRSQAHQCPDGGRGDRRPVPGPVARRRGHARSVHARRVRQDPGRPVHRFRLGAVASMGGRRC